MQVLFPELGPTVYGKLNLCQRSWEALIRPRTIVRLPQSQCVLSTHRTG